MTLHPCPFSDWQHPLPTSPYPQITATFPDNITSVARKMPSISECRQPYRLSNLLLVTLSLTLMAGNSSVPAFCISYRRCPPVVVSSLTPCPSLPTLVQLCDSCLRVCPSHDRIAL